MSASIDIIIVNWNSGSLLYECIQSISSAVNDNFQLQRVVVVDNNSNDKSLEAIRDISLPLLILENKGNFGFAKACNQGAKDSNADFLLFLNPDTKLFADSLSIPVQFMIKKENEQIGILGIKQVGENNIANRNCARFPSLLKMAYMSIGLDKVMPKIFKPHFMIEWDHLDSRVVDQVMGSFFMIRRNLFIRLGGYDERFFVYYEDLDLALRAKKIGMKSYYLADTFIFHKVGGTSEQVKALRLFYLLRSKLQYSKKHFSFLGFAIVLALTFFPEAAVRITFPLFKGDIKSCGEVLSAYKLLIKSLIK